METATYQSQNFFDYAYEAEEAQQEALAFFLEPIPFENTWTFWFDRYLGPNLRPEEYAAAQRPLGSFDSVQNFWKYFNNIPSATQLSARCSYHVMKKGVSPIWEDRHNIRGGHLAFKVPKEQTDYLWLRVLLTVIGEQFSSQALKEGDDICGASVSIRKGESMIYIWNRRADLLNPQEFIAKVQKILGVRLLEPTYRNHSEELGIKN